MDATDAARSLSKSRPSTPFSRRTLPHNCTWTGKREQRVSEVAREPEAGHLTSTATGWRKTHEFTCMLLTSKMGQWHKGDCSVPHLLQQRGHFDRAHDNTTTVVMLRGSAPVYKVYPVLDLLQVTPPLSPTGGRQPLSPRHAHTPAWNIGRVA